MYEGVIIFKKWAGKMCTVYLMNLDGSVKGAGISGVAE
jgi:hypothetical protein